MRELGGLIIVAKRLEWRAGSSCDGGINVMRRGELGREESWRPRNGLKSTVKCGLAPRQAPAVSVQSKQNQAEGVLRMGRDEGPL
jgi:hypothetical protein